MEQESEELVGVAAIAGALGVHPTTASRYIREGLIQVFWKGGYAVTVEEVERFRREAARKKVETGRIG